MQIYNIKVCILLIMPQLSEIYFVEHYQVYPCPLLCAILNVCPITIIHIEPVYLDS